MISESLIIIILSIIVLKISQCQNFTFYALELNFVRSSPSPELPTEPLSGEPDTQDQPG